MRFAIYSDLHLEFADWTPPKLDVDVVILAGDIAVGCAGLPWARRTFGDNVRILYVTGNHEPYDGSSLAGIDRRFREVSKDYSIDYLQNNSVIIDGVHIAGTTLWTDFDGQNPLAMFRVQGALNDYRRIVGPGGTKLLAQHTLDMHAEAMKFLTTVAGEATVIITHHAPSITSVHSKYVGNIINAGYYSSLDAFVRFASPRLWVHGHIHQAKDYKIGDTRVVCNPRGYPNEPTGFNPELVVEVPS